MSDATADVAFALMLAISRNRFTCINPSDAVIGPISGLGASGNGIKGQNAGYLWIGTYWPQKCQTMSCRLPHAGPLYQPEPQPSWEAELEHHASFRIIDKERRAFGPLRADAETAGF